MGSMTIDSLDLVEDLHSYPSQEQLDDFFHQGFVEESRIFEFSSIIQDVGMSDFTSVFVASHDEDMIIINPQTLITMEKNQKKQERLAELYDQELNEFHRRFHLKYLSHFSPETIVQFIATSDNIHSSVLDHIRQHVSDHY